MTYTVPDKWHIAFLGRPITVWSSERTAGHRDTRRRRVDPPAGCRAAAALANRRQIGGPPEPLPAAPPVLAPDQIAPISNAARTHLSAGIYSEIGLRNRTIARDGSVGQGRAIADVRDAYGDGEGVGCGDDSGRIASICAAADASSRGARMTERIT